MEKLEILRLIDLRKINISALMGRKSKAMQI